MVGTKTSVHRGPPGLSLRTTALEFTENGAKKQKNIQRAAVLRSKTCCQRWKGQTGRDWSPLSLFLSEARGAEGGHAAVQHSGAQLRSLPLHQRGAPAQRGALHPRQHLLPLPGHPAGTARGRERAGRAGAKRFERRVTSPSLSSPPAPAPVRERPAGEHLHRRVLREVHLGDHQNAQGVEAHRAAQR